MKVEISTDDISAIHYLPAKDNKKNIVKFTSRRDKNRVMAARKNS